MTESQHTEPQLIDQLASLARTALDDPGALPGAARPWTGPTDDPTLYYGQGYVPYALDRLDDIIDLLNPSEETPEAYARSLTVLGRHLAERQSAIEQNELSYEEHGAATREAYETAYAALASALDALDEAIEVLQGDDETIDYELADAKGRPDVQHPSDDSPRTETHLRIVVDVESDPPQLLGTLMPAREDDENIVRYFDSSSDEEEHIAPEDCVRVITVTL